MKEKTAREIYADIIDLPHHQSRSQKHMSLHDRAAQFAPFSALSGYGDMVDEERRYTDHMQELSEWEMEKLNMKLEIIDDAIKNGQNPVIMLTHFVPDTKKSGGSYETMLGTVKRIDLIFGKIEIFGSEDISDKTVKPVEIQIINIREISGELVDMVDEH